MFIHCCLLFRHEAIGDVRGRGLVQAVEMVECQASKKPAPALATQVRKYSQKNPKFRIFMKIKYGIFISTLLYSLLTPFKKREGGLNFSPDTVKKLTKTVSRAYILNRDSIIAWSVILFVLGADAIPEVKLLISPFLR
jgi:hypothetical protein